MDCTTKHVNRVTGLLEDKPKRAFATNELAIAHAKQVNSLPDRKFKVVAYKCGTCHKFHVGRNGNEISNKEKQKWTKKVEFKIVGKIDLK